MPILHTPSKLFDGSQWQLNDNVSKSGNYEYICSTHTQTQAHTHTQRHGHLRTIDMHATWCVGILNSCVCAYVWVGGWFKRLLWSKEMRKIGIVDVPFNFKLHHAAALSKLSKSQAPLVCLRVCVAYKASIRGCIAAGRQASPNWRHQVTEIQLNFC